MRVSVVAASPHGAARKGEDGQEKQDVVVHRATVRREQVEVCQRCSVINISDAAYAIAIYMSLS